jgi:hypothetical protein
MDFLNEVAKPETALKLQKMLGYDLPTLFGYNAENKLVYTDLDGLFDKIIPAPTMREIIVSGLIPKLPQNYISDKKVISTSTYISMWYNEHTELQESKVIHCISFEQGQSLELSEVIIDDNFGDAYCRLSLELISLRLIKNTKNVTQN